MSAAAALGGREKTCKSAPVSQRHGAIYVLPYSGGQCSVGLFATAGVLAVAGGFPASDQALVLAHEFALLHACSA